MMTPLAIPALLAALAAPAAQDDLFPTGKIAAVRTGDREKKHYVEADVSTNLPRGAVVSVECGTASYDYIFTDDYFALQPPEFYLPFRKIGNVNAEKSARRIRVDLPRAGIYLTRVRFERARQADPKKLQNVLGRWYSDYVLDETIVPVGIEAVVFDELIEDSRICRRIVDDTLKAVEELVKAAEKGEANWEPETLRILDDLIKIEEKIADRMEKTLLRGTYRYLADVLANVKMSKQLIQAYYVARKAEEKKGAGGGPDTGPAEWEDGTEGDSVDHPKDEAAGDGAPPSTVGGGRISFKRMKNQLERGIAVRARETTLWALQFARQGTGSLHAAAARLRAGESASTDAETDALSAADRAFAGLGRVIDAFDKDRDFAPIWTLDRETSGFAELPRLLKAYRDALVAALQSGPTAPESDALREQREAVEKLMERYDRKSLGEPPR